MLIGVIFGPHLHSLRMALCPAPRMHHNESHSFPPCMTAPLVNLDLELCVEKAAEVAWIPCCSCDMVLRAHVSLILPRPHFDRLSLRDLKAIYMTCTLPWKLILVSYIIESRKASYRYIYYRNQTKTIPDHFSHHAVLPSTFGVYLAPRRF